MKATKDIKKKKVIADLLDKKFNQLDKLVGGVGCTVRNCIIIGDPVCLVGPYPKCNLC